ncbi:MAG: endonuclease [Anaerolineae bacterium]
MPGKKQLALGLLIVVGLVLLFFTGQIPGSGKDITGDNPPTTPGNTTIESFARAKQILLADIYADRDATFYCGSAFSQNKTVSHQTSGYRPFDPNDERAYRLEWEHVVPASAFGQSFKAWRDGHPKCVDDNGAPFHGRECARLASPKFRLMEADMVNLVPAIGEVNRMRSNYSFALIPGEPRAFGRCNIEIEDRKVEPPDNRFGDIARIYRYMDSVYPGHGIISDKNKALFESWARLDPVDRWECERAKRIEAIQKNENQVVKAACQQAEMW